jgi:hypothetical protein
VGRRLTVGAFQFAASSDPERNLAALERGMGQASKRGIRLLATQAGMKRTSAPDWLVEACIWWMEIVVSPPSFGRRGRIQHSSRLCRPQRD